MNSNLGSKYQSKDGKIYRSIKYKSFNQLSMKDLETGEFKIFDNDYILNSMVKLAPDAVLNIMLTEYDTNGFKGNDVYFVVYRIATIEAGGIEPDLILRQDVYSYMKNPFATDNRIYVGDCITKFTLPDSDTKMMNLFEYSKVIKNNTYDLYSDDTLEDILEIVKTKPYDAVLEELYKERQKDNPMITGYCKSVKELCEDNHFIEAYRSLFNITSIDWPIVLGKRSYNDEGDIILNSKQKKAIEDMLRKYITDIKVLEYGYDIDVAEIVSYSHIMVSDSTEKIYLIAYTVVGDYPVDDDIAKAMGVMD